jgi:hypothetical protein
MVGVYRHSRLTSWNAGAHAERMSWTRLLDRGNVRRTAIVDATTFPHGVRHRFAGSHADLTAEDIQTVEAATRQWFRLAARNPRAHLSMPSVVVDDLWHEWVLHTREYADFCEAAFGRFLHHVPDSPGAAAHGHTRLLATLRLARQDEPGCPDQLPLLFRVDRQLAVDGGRGYLADCGGRSQCHPVPGSVCLRHVAGEPTRSARTLGRDSLSRLGLQGHGGGGGGVGGGGGGGGCGGG